MVFYAHISPGEWTVGPLVIIIIIIIIIINRRVNCRLLKLSIQKKQEDIQTDETYSEVCGYEVESALSLMYREQKVEHSRNIYLIGLFSYM
jgi:predicted Holliday junction resolvase-like endonuclease